jgi:hypothetical protein
MTILELAKVAHEMNRVYCQLSGDDSVQPWDKATDTQRKGMIFGVVHQLKMPGADTTSLHRGLFKALSDNGWRFGDKIDHVKGTHPGCLPFQEMSPEYKARTLLFTTLVEQMKPFLKEK